MCPHPRPQVVHPYASVRDPASGTELCSFRLEDVPASQRLVHTSAVMLHIFRGATAGQVGFGKAGGSMPPSFV